MKYFWVMLAGWLAVAMPVWANGGQGFPFHVGEKLTYQVLWGPLVAGRATLEVAGIEKIDNHDCYHLIAEARTSGVVDMLFRVSSRTESWLDVQGLFTRRYRQHRTEGKHRRADDSHYDYAAGTITTTNLVNGKLRVHPLQEPVQDLISSLYYVRTLGLQLDVEHQFRVNMTGTEYRVTAKPDQRKPMYFNPLGTVQALRIEPSPTLSIVAANKGRMWFWVSDDERKLPLLVDSPMKIGRAKLVLSQIESANPELDKHSRRRNRS